MPDIETKSPRNPQEQRGRKFTCVTYLSEQQLQICLQAHYSQLRGFAYALHDKDVNKDGTPKESHTHVVLWLYNASTVARIRRWFRAVDSEGKEITTTAQVCKDISFSYEYLWHRNDPEKYQYSPDIVVSSDSSIFEKDDPDDNALNALNDIVSGVPLLEVATRYGRDFIYHYKHMESLVSAIMLQQKGGDPFEVPERRSPSAYR